MATNYWQSNSQPLGVNYLTELLPMLILEEGTHTELIQGSNYETPYFDTAKTPNATIGIGVNISLTQNMALVLQSLGAINANQTVAEQQGAIKGVSIALNLEQPCHVAHALD